MWWRSAWLRCGETSCGCSSTSPHTTCTRTPPPSPPRTCATSPNKCRVRFYCPKMGHPILFHQITWWRMASRTSMLHLRSTCCMYVCMYDRFFDRFSVWLEYVIDLSRHSSVHPAEAWPPGGELLSQLCIVQCIHIHSYIVHTAVPAYVHPYTHIMYAEINKINIYIHTYIHTYIC